MQKLVDGTTSVQSIEQHRINRGNNTHLVRSNQEANLEDQRKMKILSDNSI